MNWQRKRQQLYKVSTPCLDDDTFKKEELEKVGQLSDVCSQIVLKCFYLARLGGPDILWSVNKVARAVTQWTRACHRRSARLISYTHHTSAYRQYCHCRLSLFQDSDFAGELQDSKSTPGGILSLFPQVGCAKKEKVSVSHHISTESETIS